MSETVIPARTRVAPSPTGDPHVGTAFMALFDLAWARKTGGQFVLRIEDTDQARLVAGSEDQIYESLAWLGLQPDEGPHVGGEHGPYRQSERLTTYRPFVEQLVEAGHAYYCWCSSERLAELRREQEQSKASVTGYDRLCHGMTRDERAQLAGFSETPVVRMLIPDDVPLTFQDIVRGEVKAPRPDDQVILKADGFPTYHMAVVVDDHLMGINTVVRGEEWISSTPKHVLLYQWLGWELPQFAHMPLLRNTDKSKISKRKNPAARLMWFKEEGYLPEAVRNFLQLLGYAGDDEQEVKTFEQFVEEFDWAKVNPVGPIFDLKKLDWLNGHYLRSLSAEELADRIMRFEEANWTPSADQVEVLRKAVPIIQERLVLLKDALPQLDYLFIADGELTVDDDAAAALADNAAEVLDAAIAVAEQVPFDTDSIQAALKERLVEGMGIKPKFAFAPIRVAISGRRVSPPLFESMEILGRESSLTRLKALRATL
ncbi:glutamate--tRNA ligase [Tessaracoccus sp. MC1865]|uniref:glutamate--tRNA ligase n=1 Tax=Tessaracoccus sp. MC1865 TaxID=2760310 RepID=UPI0015FEEEBA|nr:glutamate--tRNA ligase [Tessaracoccus sp. MC1865]MBB1483765.1 glutamate--tRNA ligase [Tessaracoccus sp. MC1865]QTO36834.1 glutamate--tRNA ligase [Tessaracoccus sp. MC1865]